VEAAEGDGAWSIRVRLDDVGKASAPQDISRAVRMSGVDPLVESIVHATQHYHELRPLAH
jgi:hypothetical protein